MEKTDDFIEKRIRWKARKFGLPTASSMFYENVSSNVRDYLNACIDEAISGKPILFFTKPSLEWTLLCTKQVICYDRSKTTFIAIIDIESLNTKIDGPKKKEFNKLIVTDKQKQQFTLHTDKGKDYFALHNTLLMLIRLG